eukprot:10988990-Alexandrium_andersonii.AAC.1
MGVGQHHRRGGLRAVLHWKGREEDRMAGRLRVELCGPHQLAGALVGRPRRGGGRGGLRAARGLPPVAA